MPVRVKKTRQNQKLERPCSDEQGGRRHFAGHDQMAAVRQIDVTV
jgi:hypothetical protein